MVRYPLGQPVCVSTTDVTGALVNATTLTLTVKLVQADGPLWQRSLTNPQTLSGMRAWASWMTSW